MWTYAVLSAQKVQDKEGAGVWHCEMAMQANFCWDTLGDQFPREAHLSEDHYPAIATRGLIKTFNQEDTGSLGASFCSGRLFPQFLFIAFPPPPHYLFSHASSVFRLNLPSCQFNNFTTSKFF